MLTALPLTRELVLIGGGHAHALVLRRWGMRPLPGVRVTLVNPGPTAPYTGMLPGHVAGHYDRETLEIDLVRLARHAGARLILGRVDAIDREARRIRIEGRGEIAYDAASLDIGITSDMPDLPGFAAHAVAAKPLGRFAEVWDRFVRGPDGDVAVIGGGVAGVELALAAAWRLRDRKPRVTVIDRAAALPAVSAQGRRILLRRLEAAGVALLEHSEVSEITAREVRLEEGHAVPADLVIGAAGARPHDWLAGTGLPLTDGYVTVGPDLRSVGDARIFAVRRLRAPLARAAAEGGRLRGARGAGPLRQPSGGAGRRTAAPLPAAARLSQAGLARAQGGDGRAAGAGGRASAALAMEGPDRPQVHAAARRSAGDAAAAVAAPGGGGDGRGAGRRQAVLRWLRRQGGRRGAGADAGRAAGHAARRRDEPPRRRRGDPAGRRARRRC